MASRTTQDVLDPVGRQVIAALSNAVAASLTIPTDPSGSIQVRRARVSVETQAIRYYETGDAPTTTDGHPVPVGTTFLLEGMRAIGGFRVISQTAAAKLTVTYYR